MSNKGKKVKVHYTGHARRRHQGSTARATAAEPIEFTCMAGQMSPASTAPVDEMAVGEVRDVHLEPKDAYGEPNPAMMLNAKVGQKLYVFMGNRPVPVTITKADNGEVTLDANHELAGKPLNFNIELVEVEGE